MLLAVDPGAGLNKPSIGVAKFRLDRGSLQELHQFTFEDFDKYLLAFKKGDITQIVYEDYRIKREFATRHIGSRVEVVRSIGLIEAFAGRNNIPVAIQKPLILRIAEKWFQIEMPKNHDESHQISAMLHGMYWLKEQGIIQTRLEEDMAKNG